MSTNARVVDVPRGVASPEVRAARVGGLVVGHVLGAAWALVWGLACWCRRHPKVSLVVGSLAGSWLVGGWVTAALGAALWLSLFWLVLTRWPEAAERTVGWTLPRRFDAHPDSPGGVTPETTHSGGGGEGLVGVHRRLHRVGQDPETGRDVYVPLVEVEPEMWPEVVDVSEARSTR